MEQVKAKKHLGQHFLRDKNIAKRIVQILSFEGYDEVLEIGPGMGVLTEFLLLKTPRVTVIEIDKESVDYLDRNFPALNGRILSNDFLKHPIQEYFGGKQFAIIGNFPYNISSQIVFKMLEMKAFVPEFAGMFQKEVAERICQSKGSKTYGILSVLVQAFYDAKYLFTVSEEVFSPPPKVKSGVLILKRKENFTLNCSEKLFTTVVKTAFNQRRKTLRNSLKPFFNEHMQGEKILQLRPEELSWKDFVLLTQQIEQGR